MVSKKADMFLCDIKHMDSEIHERFTGVRNDSILNNIRLLSEAGKNIIIRIRTTITPSFFDDKICILLLNLIFCNK